VIVASPGLTVALSVAVVCEPALALPVVTLGGASVPTSASPALSTAAHSPWSVHETPLIEAVPSGFCETQDGPEDAGLSLA